jgi:uncharacterized membrane protein
MQNLRRRETAGHGETTRLEAFSDGVFAIAITLLVLEVRVPPIEDAPPAALRQALADLWPNYLGYIISFATIGIMWANHHTIVRSISRVDHYLILANLLFLFFVAAIPFPTALMADYLGHAAERVGVVVYSGWFLLTALSYNLLWRYAAGGNRLIAPEANPAVVRAITSRFNIGPPAYALALLLAFVSTAASLLLLLLLALAYVLPYSNPERQASSKMGDSSAG